MSHTFGEFYWRFFFICSYLPNLQHSFQALNDHPDCDSWWIWIYLSVSVSDRCCFKRVSTSLAVKRWEIWFHTAPYCISCSIVPRLNSNHHIRYTHTHSRTNAERWKPLGYRSSRIEVLDLGVSKQKVFEIKSCLLCPWAGQFTSSCPIATVPVIDLL